MKYIWAIYTNAEPGRENEYNDWYNDIHVPDVLRVPGVTSAERFHLAPLQTKPGPEGIAVVKTDEAGIEHKYLALYAIETDDLEGVLQAVADRAGTDEMTMSSAMSPEIGTMCFQTGTPRV